MAQAKRLPSREVVRSQMVAEIQAQKVEGSYDDDEVFNGDETGIFFGAPPKRQYVQLTADSRGAAIAM